MKFVTAIGMRMARRSKWLARRIWLVAAAEAALITRHHWKQLEPEERKRLSLLLRKSRGRPSNLSSSERREASELLEKLDYAKLGGDIAVTLLPFRPFGRMVEFALHRVNR
jgi:hypothetical protein